MRARLPGESVDHLDEIEYRDLGCEEIASRCQECPLPRCRFDPPAKWLERLQEAYAAHEVVSLRRAKWRPDRVAAVVGVSRRQVFRMQVSCGAVTEDSMSGKLRSEQHGQGLTTWPVQAEGRNPEEPVQASCPRCHVWVHLPPGGRRHCHNCALWLRAPEG